MKKFVFFLMAALFFMSCGSSGNDGKNTNAKDTLSSNPATQAGAQNATAEVSDQPIAISEDDFVSKVFDFRSNGEWKYKGDKPAIIDFYADWCGPCRMIAPYMKEFASKYKGEIYVYKVNTDYAQDLSMYFKINAIPAVMLVPMKGDYKMVVGANGKDYYESMIKTFLLNKK
jgi:thioredoxin